MNDGAVSFIPMHAALNFINSLERIPQTIEQYKEKNAALAKDIPLLKEIANKQWKKEDELLDFAEDSKQSPYVVRDGFFVKTDEKWEKVRYDEILWVRAFETCC